MFKAIGFELAVVLCVTLAACDKENCSKNKEWRDSNEPTVANLTSKASPPTYVYVENERTGKLIFIGESIGYGIPAKIYHGLGNPSTSMGRWMAIKDSSSGVFGLMLIEPQVIVSFFRLSTP